MSPSPESPHPRVGVDFRLVIAALLLLVAGFFTWRTIDGLEQRRRLRTDLAEISHVRYGLLNADVWVAKLTPILNARIDALDLTADTATLRPAIERMLYGLLDQIKEKMTAPASPQSKGSGLGALIGGNSMIVNMMVEMLRPNVPEYARMVIEQLQKPENKDALKKYLKGVLAEGAQRTFGSADMKWYARLLELHGCSDAAQCQQSLGAEIHRADGRITFEYLTVLAVALLGFLLLMIGRPMLERASVVVLLLFCIVLLVGGVLTPMIEVEARLSQFSMTFLGQPITFSDQLLYFQSKSVLEVFHTLITIAGRPDMWLVAVLVLMFSIIFPILKTLTLGVCLFRPSLLQRSRLVRFLALESSKWSMADVMALAIFMAFVAFNGLIPNALSNLRQNGADLVIPTNASKILPGYQLFIGFCLASLFLSKKLEHGIRPAANIS